MKFFTKSHTSSYLLRNVELWRADKMAERVDIEVRQGKLVAISSPGSSRHQVEIDATGLSLLPTGVDPQVHLRVPGQLEKETPEQGMAAALYGGVGCLLTMPNTKPIVDAPEICQQVVDLTWQAAQEHGVEVLVSAAISKKMVGKEVTDYKALAEWGVAAFTDDGLGVVSDDIMRRVFRASAEFNIPVLQHAEFPDHPGVLADGPVVQACGMEAYPAAAEYEMVARDIRLLREFRDARYHVLHVSSAKTLELVREAKEAGLRVSCEVTPHHLYFSSHDIEMHNKSYKMNPPLRSPNDQYALKQALSEGLIDFVATDHAPHEADAKHKKWQTAAYGTTGLETSLRTLLTLYNNGELSSQRVAEVFSKKPAEFLGVEGRYGSFELEKTFRGVLFDARAKSQIEISDLKSHSKNNCFLGHSLNGRISAVFNGEDIFHFLNGSRAI